MVTTQLAKKSQASKILKSSPTPAPFMVKPRWPHKNVHLSEEAYRRLVRAQEILVAHGLTLVLTHVYQRQGGASQITHRLAGMVGMALFCMVYPHRYSECRSIFFPHEHGRFDESIDVRLRRSRTILNFLPIGPFTPRGIVRRRRRLYERELLCAWDALEAAGFVIHDNDTAAMRIHCKVQPLDA